MEVDVDVDEESLSKKIERMEKRGSDLIRVLPSLLSGDKKTERMVEVFQREIEELKQESLKTIKDGKRGLETSGEEDAVIGGIIVAGGACTKAKKKRNKKKRKQNPLEKKEKKLKIMRKWKEWIWKELSEIGQWKSGGDTETPWDMTLR